MKNGDRAQKQATRMKRQSSELVSTVPVLVIVHDVAPVFESEIRTILQTLQPLLGAQIAAGVVPDWKGRGTGMDQPGYRRLLEEFGEVLLHGWTHHRDLRPGLVSALTNHADEFGRLPLQAIQSRIELAQRAMLDLTGRKAAGFLPPAWRLPVPSRQLRGLDYVMRYRRLESCHQRTASRPLVTWSWDWGKLTFGAGLGEFVPRLLQAVSPQAAVCVAIHPVDVTNGWFPRAEQLIRQLLESGHCATVPGKWMSGEGFP